MNDAEPSRFALVLVFATISVTTGILNLHANGLSGLPRSALPGVKSIDTVERAQLPRVDVEALRAEDADRDRSVVPLPRRFATALPVTFSPTNSGTWESLENGSRLWRLRISSPGALSLNLGLENFNLPEGATFWVHSPDGSGVQGPYTAKDQNAAGGLWTAVVLGDEIVAELHLTKGKEADFEIVSVNHGYRLFIEPTTGTTKRGGCEINSACPEGDPWRDQNRSVALVTVGGVLSCTGQLVDNTAHDFTPYLLTADHCFFDALDASTVVAYWNYENASCGEINGGSLSQNQSGSTLVAAWTDSDMALIRLDDQPLPSFNVYYSGWDARDLIPESTTTIHHPQGGEKSISVDFDPPTITSYGEDTPPGDGNFLRVGDWDVGSTEGGSSGSCLFDNMTKRCIGTLRGGYAACGNDEPDWYGRMARHWTGGGTPQTRLSDWLDPLGGDTLFLDGKNGTGAETMETWMISAVASLAGVSPTDWKSQVAVVNPTSEMRSASLYFVAKGQAWPGELLSGPHFVEASESLYLDDVLQPERPASGLLYVTVNGSGTAISCRTFTPFAQGGTFGQGQPGILLSSASRATELILPLIHSAPGVFRTNVGFAQTSAGTYQVQAEIYSSEGTLLAQKTYSFAAAWDQVDDIFRNMGIGGAEVEGGWIRVRLVSGSPSFWTTYATVIDENTADPTYILPVAP
jgi:hypothetical protein